MLGTGNRSGVRQVQSELGTRVMRRELVGGGGGTVGEIYQKDKV